MQLARDERLTLDQANPREHGAVRQERLQVDFKMDEWMRKREKPKRLTPLSDTLRELFLKSGNLCAFPNCAQLMMNEKGVFVGQLCHIEAAEPGGERFNANMSNEDRRAAPNLMLMCYPHHQITNDVEEYTVNKLRKMKQEHERRFAAPDRAILEQLTDWTTRETPVGVKNLVRLNDVLKLKQPTEELDKMATELNEYIDKLGKVPVEVRQFVGAIAKRIHKMDDTWAVVTEGNGASILVSDVKAAFKLGDSRIRDKLAQLESYGLGGLDFIDTNLGQQPAIRLSALPSGWLVWLDVVSFCKADNVQIERFTEALDFSPFDSL